MAFNADFLLCALLSLCYKFTISCDASIEAPEIVPDELNLNLLVQPKTNVEFAICSLFRNQDRYLSEWISYHSCLGIEHFYLYNDASVDNFTCILRPYVRAGLVTLFHTNFRNADGPQIKVYDHCLKLAKSKDIRWTAFIDPDEFVFLQGQKIRDVFGQFKNFSAVQLSWVHFVSKEKQLREEIGMVTDTYIMKERKPAKGQMGAKKTIVYARDVQKMHVHHPELVEGARCSDELLLDIECSQVGLQRVSTMFIHHYSSKSYDYFRCKALTPHAKRSGSLYRYGGSSEEEALKKVKYIYRKEVNRILHHAHVDQSLSRSEGKCMKEKMKMYTEPGCEKTRCWCQRCQSDL